MIIMGYNIISIMTFQEKLQALLSLIDNWLVIPNDTVQLEKWIDEAETLAYSYEFSDIEQQYVDKILDNYEEQFKEYIKQLATKGTNVIPSREFLDEIVNRKQIEQRTPEWYAQMNSILSASELGNLWASNRQRAIMVVSKTVPYVPRNQQLAIPSDSMSAFDWGIRFEPVVKQIYEYKYGVTIKELGRLINPNDSRCSASPDGLIYNCPKNERTGRLIEIKCPVTRQIDGTVPKDYYAQMQMQLQVTGCNICDYVEAVFSSKYNNTPQREGTSLYSGTIALIRYAEMKGGQEFYYIYGPINEDSWSPEINEEEEVVELIPWRLVQWSEQMINRSEEWWTSIKPVIDAFWEDVEKAKRGEFSVPDSTRSKRQKIEKCMIVFNKLDETGFEIVMPAEL